MSCYMLARSKTYVAPEPGIVTVIVFLAESITCYKDSLNVFWAGMAFKRVRSFGSICFPVSETKRTVLFSAIVTLML